MVGWALLQAGLVPRPAVACWLLDALAEAAEHLVGDLTPAVVDGQ